MPPQTVFIASPLESEHVAAIRAAHPELTVLHAPDLLPPIRYIADHKGHPMQRSEAQQRRWHDLIAQADILWDLPAAEDMPFAAKLRWIQTTSTGVGQAVRQLGLDTRGIRVTTARGVHAGPLAEFVFMALLTYFRKLRELEAEQRAHRWVRTCYTEVAGRTLVIIGAGDLARGCAKLAKALDMRVIAIARDLGKARAHNALFDAIRPVAALHATLREADAVVVTVPHTPATEHLIDAAALAAMPRGIAFVNIARGQVIDEAALIASLREGHIGFAALDVATIEPLPVDSPLWDFPNVLISPHSASTVTTENRKITEIFVHNLHCWMDGNLDAMKNVLDTQLMY